MATTSSSTDAKSDNQDFFASTTPPKWLNEQNVKIKDFLSQCEEATKGQGKVVYITSGGTKVPLEKNMVRCIDNFSTGSRGASSAERFLAQGYHVIFAHRVGTCIPFARHIQRLCSSHFDLSLLHCLAIDADNQSIASSQTVAASSTSSPGAGAEAVGDGTKAGPTNMQQTGGISLQLGNANAMSEMQQYIRLALELEAHKRLLLLPFDSVTDYLHQMRLVASALSTFSSRALIFAAAAVSDFYVPESELAAHKIQSGDGDLVLRLPQTPKLLPSLHTWAPNAFIVSFKLETDTRILSSKAKGAIRKYGVHMVVANELSTRYDKVVLFKSTRVFGNGSTPSSSTSSSVSSASSASATSSSATNDGNDDDASIAIEEVVYKPSLAYGSQSSSTAIVSTLLAPLAPLPVPLLGEIEEVLVARVVAAHETFQHNKQQQ